MSLQLSKGSDIYFRAGGWNGKPYYPHKLVITGSTPVPANCIRKIINVNLATLMVDKIKFSDLPVDTILKSLKEEIKKNKEHDKYNIATIILVSIYNAITEAYLEVREERKNN